jgi:Purple acid Phosphatase, N-terminal domain
MRKQMTAFLLAFGMTAGLAVAQNAEDKTKSAAGKTKDAVTGAANKTADTAKGAVSGGKQASKKPQNVKIVKGPVVEWVADDTATIAWSTNVRSGTILRYGTDPNNLTKQTDAAYGGPTHRVKITNLTPATKYYYSLDDTKAAGTGTEAKSQVYEFETVAKGQKGKKYSFVKTKE